MELEIASFICALDVVLFAFAVRGLRHEFGERGRLMLAIAYKYL